MSGLGWWAMRVMGQGEDGWRLGQEKALGCGVEGEAEQAYGLRTCVDQLRVGEVKWAECRRRRLSRLG